MLTLYVLLLTNFFHSFCRCCGSKSSSVPCTIDSFVRGLVVCSTPWGSQCFTIHIYNYGSCWLVTQYFYLLLHTPPVLSFLFFVNISLSLTLLPSFLNIILFFFPILLSFSPSFLFFILLFSTSAHPFPPPLFSASLLNFLLLCSFFYPPPPVLPQFPPVLPQSSPSPPPVLPQVLPITSLLLLFFSHSPLSFSSSATSISPRFSSHYLFFVLCSLSSSLFSLHRNFSFSFIVSAFLLLFFLLLSHSLLFFLSLFSSIHSISFPTLFLLFPSLPSSFPPVFSILHLNKLSSPPPPPSIFPLLLLLYFSFSSFWISSALPSLSLLFHLPFSSFFLSSLSVS